MVLRSNGSVVKSIMLTVTVFLSFTLILSSQPPANVKSLIFSLQNEFCGRQFCASRPLQKPPLCREQTDYVMILDQFGNITRQTMTPQGMSPAERQNEPERQKAPPCSKCSCSDNCVVYGNCCADKNLGREYYFDCQKIYVYTSDSYKLLYSYVVTKCLPDAPNYNDALADNCENGELGYIPDGRLVNALHPQYNTNVTFRNKYCAMCYNITNYTPWDVYISCREDMDYSNHTDINSIIRSVKGSKVCKVTTNHQDAVNTPICHRYVGMESTCNVSGQWQEYNETLEKACNYYLNPALSYRNIFCALCNGIPRDNLMCPSGDYILPSESFLFTPFSAILNFDKSDVEVVKGSSSSYPVRRIGKQTEHQCRTGDVFDAISKKCREIYCPLVTRTDNNTCVPLVPAESYVVTLWKLTVHYLDDVVIPYARFFSTIGGSVIRPLRGLLADVGFSVSGSSFSDFAGIHSLYSLIVKESHLELELILVPDFRLKLSRQRLANISNFTTNITWKSKRVAVNVVADRNPRNVTDLLLMPMVSQGYVPFGFHDIKQSSIIRVPLAFNVSCPMVRFKSNDILVVNKSTFIHDNIVDDKYFVKDNTDYFICIDNVLSSKLVKTFITEQPKTSDGFRVEQLVTVICFSCSLIFLMLTLLVYILIRQLHTLPGLNLILLTFSLFVAQALYFFGAGASSLTTATVCTVIGVLIHYFWLVSFAWMNVCCAHMFRVFNDIFSSLAFADDKKGVLVKYSMFSFGVPFVIVSVTITVSYITSGYTSIGYGGSAVCFVASGITSVLSFGVPAGITILTTSTLLVFTMVSLRRAQNRIDNKSESGTNDTSKFFKLSTITGLSWLFGFLGYFFKRIELLYVFTVLTAGQGVFIFFSFVVSRRILKLVRERLGCTVRKGSVDTQRFHDNTSSRGHTTSETCTTEGNVTSQL